jgi:AbrB family looped-hinge helix DNA binding protein
MATATMTSKGQLVIPSALRAKYGLKKGTKITILEEADGIHLIKTRELIRMGRGLAKTTSGKSLMEVFLEEKEKERKL